MQALLDREYDDSVARLERDLLQLELEKAKLEYRDLCRRSFLAFVRHMEPTWVIPWFHLRICAIFQRIGDNELKRAIINMPPGHSKSGYARLFLAWDMGRHPELKSIVTSYSDEISSDNTVGVMFYIDQERYREIFPLHLCVRNSNELEFAVTGGVLYSAGIMGGLTGKRATRGLLVDDPCKNAEQAASPAFQHKSEEEWKLSARSRTRDSSWILIITTRWRTDDFVGKRLEDAELNPKADQYELFVIPAVKEDPTDHDDPREMGEPLWAAGGYGKKWAEATQATLTAEQWSGQMQQNPVVMGGGIIKIYKLRFWYPLGREPAPYRMQDNEGNFITIPQMALPAYLPDVTQSWDMTFKKTEKGSFIVGQAWGSGNPECRAASFLLGQKRFRGDFEEGCQALRNLHTEFPQTRVTLMEDKANGSASQSRLKGVIAGINMVEPQGDKIERAHAAKEIHTDIYLPHPALYPWVAKEVLPELAAFPRGKNDDIVDCVTQYVNWRYAKPKYKAY